MALFRPSLPHTYLNDIVLEIITDLSNLIDFCGTGQVCGLQSAREENYNLDVYLPLEFNIC